MKEHLTIAYVTSRKNPQVEWFLDSLISDGWNDQMGKVIIVSFNCPGISQTEWKGITVHHAPPKPCVWQGAHRLTKQDWFAAANARNTALCLAPDGWIAFVDDLTVLMPGWLHSVEEAMSGGYVVAGAYRKVKNLVVKDGEVASYTRIESGEDGRWKYANADPCEAEKGWLFGCSCAMPVAALLDINGWPEIADGSGFEDCMTGMALRNAGYKLYYDRRMLTLESEEHHHLENAMRREDWHFENGKPVTGGNGGTDKSHSLLGIAEITTRFPNYCDFRELRQKVLSGEPFPVLGIPEHDWYTGLALKDL